MKVQITNTKGDRGHLKNTGTTLLRTPNEIKTPGTEITMFQKETAQVFFPTPLHSASSSEPNIILHFKHRTFSLIVCHDQNRYNAQALPLPSHVN